MPAALFTTHLVALSLPIFARPGILSNGVSGVCRTASSGRHFWPFWRKICTARGPTRGLGPSATHRLHSARQLRTPSTPCGDVSIRARVLTAAEVARHPPSTFAVSLPVAQSRASQRDRSRLAGALGPRRGRRARRASGACLLPARGGARYHGRVSCPRLMRSARARGRASAVGGRRDRRPGSLLPVPGRRRRRGPCGRRGARVAHASRRALRPH